MMKRIEGIPNTIRDRIIRHVYEEIKMLNVEPLIEEGIALNTLMEYMYITCCYNYLDYEPIDLGYLDKVYIMLQIKMDKQELKAIMDGDGEITSIDDHSRMQYKFHKKNNKK